MGPGAIASMLARFTAVQADGLSKPPDGDCDTMTLVVHRLASLALSFGGVTVVLATAGCTLLATFDERAEAGCVEGTCGSGGMDATIRDVAARGEASAPIDAYIAPDVAPPHDVYVSADVGDCTALSEGSPCGKPDACQMAATCQGGACTANPLPDMTSCGTAPDICHEGPVCMSGVCQPAAEAPVTTTCGTAADSCHSAPVCMGGTCTPVAANDGKACGAAPDVCHTAPTCAAGVCGTPGNASASTTCGAAPDACHDAPKCSKGACQPAVALAEGTNWNTGDVYARCCGGNAVEATTTTNCGVCGWTCASGQACAMLGGEYACTGCTADTECLSNCCSESPAPNHCSPGNCAGACTTGVCTGGSHCVVGATVDYCAY